MHPSTENPAIGAYESPTTRERFGVDIFITWRETQNKKANSLPVGP